jgi:hypothetical protein
MHIVRGSRIEEMNDSDLGALYVQLSREQLDVGSAEAARALDTELEAVLVEMSGRDLFLKL